MLSAVLQPFVSPSLKPMLVQSKRSWVFFWPALTVLPSASGYVIETLFHLALLEPYDIRKYWCQLGDFVTTATFQPPLVTWFVKSDKTQDFFWSLVKYLYWQQYSLVTEWYKSTSPVHVVNERWGLPWVLPGLEALWRSVSRQHGCPGCSRSRSALLQGCEWIVHACLTKLNTSLPKMWA